VLPVGHRQRHSRNNFRRTRITQKPLTPKGNSNYKTPLWGRGLFTNMKKTLFLLLLVIGVYQNAHAQGCVGEIRLFAGTFAPKGWAFCDGKILNVSQNTALYSVLGNTYGGQNNVA
jgi:hypothetical protein